MKQKLYKPETFVLEIKILLDTDQEAWEIMGKLKDKYGDDLGWSIYNLAIAKSKTHFKECTDHLLEFIKMKEEKIEN